MIVDSFRLFFVSPNSGYSCSYIMHKLVNQEKNICKHFFFTKYVAFLVIFQSMLDIGLILYIVLKSTK